ncbi:MAG: LptF/LptG family permease [Firmicutes bacterium]|nr:LptF/LptG family permease [Bacillota bacterium]MDD4262958.1 LptF/LptG family permease [Bacillota bacterium]MDD4693169.1 LptF/LptG family permease [Bacillota bacterium]
MKLLSILDKYIYQELILPFLFGVLAFASIFVAADLVYLARVAVSVGAPFLQAVELALMKFPQVLVYVLPMSALMGVLLAVGKLSQNSELIAVQASGQSFWRTFRPIIVFGIIVTLLGLFVNDILAPAAITRYEALFNQMVRNKPMPVIKKNVILEEYQGGLLKTLLYATKFDPTTNTFTDISYFTFEGGKPESTTQAKKMVWTDKAWYLEQGRTIFYDNLKTTEMTFDRNTQPVSINYQPSDVTLVNKDPSQMGIRELRKRILLTNGQGDINDLLIEYHQKISIPFASLIFALLGATLAASSPRSGSARGFGLSIAIVFLYYVLLTLSSVLGQGGHLPPIIAAWTQNIIIGAWSLGLALKRGR